MREKLVILQYRTLAIQTQPSSHRTVREWDDQEWASRWQTGCEEPQTVQLRYCQAVVAHTFNPSTQEAEAGESLWVQGQPGLQKWVPGQAPKLQRNPVSKKQNKNKTRHYGIHVKSVMPALVDFFFYCVCMMWLYVSATHMLWCTYEIRGQVSVLFFPAWVLGN